MEEGIRAGNITAVLQKCVNDLLDLTDLVRGKLGAQVGSLFSHLLNHLLALLNTHLLSLACSVSQLVFTMLNHTPHVLSALRTRLGHT